MTTPHDYPLSLHDALPISTTTGASTGATCCSSAPCCTTSARATPARITRSSARDMLRPSPNAWVSVRDRKSTRLNSSHVEISYAVFCLKKKIDHERADKKK